MFLLFLSVLPGRREAGVDQLTSTEARRYFCVGGFETPNFQVTDIDEILQTHSCLTQRSQSGWFVKYDYYVNELLSPLNVYFCGLASPCDTYNKAKELSALIFSIIADLFILWLQ